MESVDLAINECDRIKKLILDLQDFNRPTSGVVLPMDIHQALGDMLLLCKNDFRSKKINIKTRYAANMPQIPAVQDQIKQVILNLLTNAAEAIPEGGGTIEITTKVFDKNIKIQLKDSGVGIKPEAIDRIFEPFFSTKSKVKGIGLGLSVSYGIIKKHDGNIEVKSKPGKGATFTIILPSKKS